MEVVEVVAVEVDQALLEEMLVVAQAELEALELHQALLDHQ